MTCVAELPNLDEIRVAVIGLGYVGLPLAVEFAKTRAVIGFDINEKRVEELNAGHDGTREVSSAELAQAAHLELTCDVDALKEVNVFIITVPTPIDAHKRPDLGPLLKASETVGHALKSEDMVI